MDYETKIKKNIVKYSDYESEIEYSEEINEKVKQILILTHSLCKHFYPKCEENHCPLCSSNFCLLYQLSNKERFFPEYHKIYKRI